METNLFFDSSGTIKQLLYAEKAVENGSLTLALVFPYQAFLVSVLPTKSLFHKPSPKLKEISQLLSLTGSGISADYNSLYSLLETHQLEHQYSFQTDLPLELAVNLVRKECAKRALTNRGKPLGTSLLLLGKNSLSKQFRLVEVTATGETKEWGGQAIGARSESARGNLEKLRNEILGRTEINRTFIMEKLLEIIKNCLETKEKVWVEIGMFDNNATEMQVLSI